MQNTIHGPHVLALLRFTEVHRRHTEALARATGEHFNIFQILGVGHLEVKTHSPILGELLNPKGHHGQGPAFLRLFLAQFGIQGFDAESPTARMVLEYHTGKVTEKSGGRIDIVVTDGKGSRILIENKIYAWDQDNQMTRYWDSDRKASLFYLTLDGRHPSNLSQDQLERTQCHCISYAKHILPWLERCRKEAACLPRVRETLSQYIKLIEELTNQSTTTCMNNELTTEVLKSQDSLAAFFTLCEQYEPVRAALIARLDAQLDEIAIATGLTRDGPLRDLYEKNACFYFSTPGLEKRNLQIGFGFDTRNYKDFYLGFATRDHTKPCPVEAQLCSAFKEQFSPEEPNSYWPASAYWEHPYRYWGQEAFEAIRSGLFAKDLRAKLDILAKITEQVCPDEAVTQT